MFAGFGVAGVFLSFMQVPWGIGWLGWVSVVPFLLACTIKTKTRALIWISYLVSVCYWLANLYWIALVTVPAYILFCLYLGIYWPVVAVCARYFRGRNIPFVIIEIQTGSYLGEDDIIRLEDTYGRLETKA